jgi:uncharacterized membrane protein
MNASSPADGPQRSSLQAGPIAWRAVGLFAAAALVLLGARFFIGGALPFLLDVSPDSYGRYWPRRSFLLTHIVAGSLALVVGPIQLWSGLRRRSLRLHRWLGRLYVASVLVGGLAAFSLASRTEASAAHAISLTVLGMAWWITTGIAWLAIRRRQIRRHQLWIVRSYIVTFSFVTFRWWAELGALRGLGSEPVAVLVWLSWVVPLLAMEIVLRYRDVFRR